MFGSSLAHRMNWALPDSIKINDWIEDRIRSADLKIEAAQSFPKNLYRSLSILER